MSILIQLRDVSKSYGSREILTGADLSIDGGDKIGAIGRNGAGKTTLCRLIQGEEEPDAGEVVISPGARLGYLRQRDPFEPDETVLAFLQRDSGEEEWRCGKVAGRFQIRGPLLESPVERLSGGYQTRVKLAAMLLREPNFLLLDEPTNYLDLKTLLLLERFLRDFPGGFLIISHDREFLKRTSTRTLEVERGRTQLFSGGIEEFLAWKEERREQDVRFNRNVEAKRRHLQSFVDRYRVRASTASRAQSKLRQMAKLHTIDVEHPIQTARIRIPSVDARSGTALRCEDLSIGYPEKTVAAGIRFDVERGERVAVLGDNGEGKTTFLRTVAEQLSSLRGSFSWGHGLTRAYYAQHVYATLPAERTVYEYLRQEAARDLERQAILDMAGSFLFSGDEVDKPIEVLSGGERARLCLAALLLGRSDVFLFDEPTNHLDFETVEVLAQALREYRGTILFTSHDRTFVSVVATSILEVCDGRVALYPSDYASYVWRMEQEVDSEQEQRRGKEPGDRRDEDRPGSGGASYRRRKELRSRRQRCRSRLGKVERSIEGLEKERESIHAGFLENPTEYAPERQARLDEIARELEAAEEEWLALQEELESIDAECGA